MSASAPPAYDKRTGAKTHVVIDEWRPLSPPHNTLKGFARAVMRSGMIIEEVAVHISADNAWCSPPARPMLDRDGAVMRDEHGAIKYRSLLNFTTRWVRESWSRQILNALRLKHPEVFE